MKKRLPAVILILSLCVGLAVPAFAAGGTAKYGLTISAPAGYEPEEITADYQVLEYTWQKIRPEGGETHLIRASSPKTVEGIAAQTLPRGATFTITGLHADADDYPWVEDKLYFDAWSDPDGDGIYEDRNFITLMKEPFGVSIVPLAETGPFVFGDDIGYTRIEPASTLGGFTSIKNPSRGGYVSQVSSSQVDLTYTADWFYELFGPNTILFISVGSSVNLVRDFLHEKATFTLLLTGESVSEPEPEPEPEPAVSFADVPEGAFYADAVAWAVKNGITSGTSETAFSPDQTCTQAQILTFLWRAAGRPDSDAETPFSGVAEGYAGALRWAYEEGMAGDSLDPNAPCTRADAMMYIWQAFGSPEAGAGSFSDIPDGAPYAPAVDWAVEQGITQGDGGADTFAPDKVCSRGHIVTFLYRAYNG